MSIEHFSFSIGKFSGWVAAAASRGICGVLSVLPARGPARAREFRVSSFEFRDARIGLANSSPVGSLLGLLGLANTYTEGEWIQITPPLGDYPHARGIQRIDAEAVTQMANSFNSVRARMARVFGGVPFYVGHPDVPEVQAEYPDKRAHGWITDVEARADGLYAKTKWSETGKELLANAHFKYFSPYWDAAEIGRLNGKAIYRPVALLSVGLTNKPNLPTNPLANEEEKETNFMTKPEIIAALGLANEATDEQIKTRLAACVAAYASLANVQAERDGAKTALSNEQAAHGSTKSSLETQLANTRTERDAHLQGRAELLVDAAIKEGRVPIANRAQWIADLKADFAGKSVALANEKASGPGANKSRTQDQGGRRDTVALENEATRRNQVTALMNEKQAKGIPYDVAWAECKRERPELFEAMARPQGAGH